MMLVFLFLLVWCIVDMAHCHQISEYRNPNITHTTCYERDSCRFILQQPAFWRQRRDSFLARNCECDRKCADYDDCCADYKHRTAKNQSVVKRKNIRMKCISSDLELNVGAYAIAECPAGYSGPQIIQKMCLSVDNINDPLMAVPVTDPNTKLTYKNRYCAECNRANPNLLLTWTISLNCIGLNSTGIINSSFVWDNISYNSTLESWGVAVNQSVYHNCKLDFSLPSYLYKRVRFCRPKLISSCTNDWEDAAVKVACESYMAVKTAKDGRFYKNIHCALCNRINLEEISCWTYVTKNGETANSFSFFLDINDSRGLLSDQNGNSSKRCRLQETYDPFSKQCRNLRRFNTNS